MTDGVTKRMLLGGVLSGVAERALAQAQSSLALSSLLPEGLRNEAILDALPGKKPLIKLAFRPPNYETPIEYFRTAITPNEAFFVRYHLADIPKVDARAWRLSIGGDGAEKSIEVSLEDLKRMPATEIVAVNQCSGNRRGLVTPHVPGVQWGYGGMGCATWRGVRLKDLLAKVGVKHEAIEVAFDGADRPLSEKTPDFVKSIPVFKALEDTTLVAYEMNGRPLPHWNGFPARIVVPGWTATYWMKHLASIKILTAPESSFWMGTAYRLPLGKFPAAQRFASQETANSTPITEILVNSLIANPIDGARIRVGSFVSIAGVAWDGGSGIRSVEISLDDGKSWALAKLGEDLGKFAFRAFNFSFAPRDRGQTTVMARATNNLGQTQGAAPVSNPAGYHHNAIQMVRLDVR
jgi:sulfite dehydrogenase